MMRLSKSDDRQSKKDVLSPTLAKLSALMAHDLKNIEGRQKKQASKNTPEQRKSKSETQFMNSSYLRPHS